MVAGSSPAGRAILDEQWLKPLSVVYFQALAVVLTLNNPLLVWGMYLLSELAIHSSLDAVYRLLWLGSDL